MVQRSKSRSPSISSGKHFDEDWKKARKRKTNGGKKDWAVGGTFQSQRYQLKNRKKLAFRKSANKMMPKVGGVVLLLFLLVVFFFLLWGKLFCSRSLHIVLRNVWNCFGELSSCTVFIPPIDRILLSGASYYNLLKRDMLVFWLREEKPINFGLRGNSSENGYFYKVSTDTKHNICFVK